MLHFNELKWRIRNNNLISNNERSIIIELINKQESEYNDILDYKYINTPEITHYYIEKS